MIWHNNWINDNLAHRIVCTCSYNITAQSLFNSARFLFWLYNGCCWELLHWTLVGSLALVVEAVHFSSARKAGGPSQPFSSWIWDLVLRRSHMCNLYQFVMRQGPIPKLGFEMHWTRVSLWLCNGCCWELLHWTLVGSLVLVVEAVHFSSARKAAGGPSQPFSSWIWDLVLRRSHTCNLYQFVMRQGPIPKLGFEMLWTCVSWWLCNGCCWELLHWTLVGSLVLLVEAVHFSSARKAGGPSQPFSSWIWDLVLRRSHTCSICHAAGSHSKAWLWNALNMCFFVTLQRLLLRVAALDACWVASSRGRSGPFQQCKKSGRAKSAVLELDLRLGVTALPHVQPVSICHAAGSHSKAWLWNALNMSFFVTL